jgi:rhodanese-related sulfurtransferase
MTPIEISVQDVKAKLDAGEIALIDCREQDEWDTARIEGATLIPMSRFVDQKEALEKLSEQNVVVHCHHGGRSLRVTMWLRENGFADAQNMTGGIDAWSQEIDATVPRY